MTLNNDVTVPSTVAKLTSVDVTLDTDGQTAPLICTLNMRVLSVTILRTLMAKITVLVTRYKYSVIVALSSYL